ncbi:hypothetical protein PanWU01x14_328040 [Parasponia andersonii]|uniref:Uncharacterized protein n=1 Tax=Parasponia andersonii TaxID=3476 RepID=A0A2P5AIV9_PARAD|nr:hypothetical protein PanWU01x14_328040 [Parasponia andersonii]
MALPNSNRQLLTGAELEAESGRKTKLELRRIQRWWWHGDRTSDGSTAGEKPFRYRNFPATISPATDGGSRQQHLALVRQRLPVTADRRVWHGGKRWHGGERLRLGCTVSVGWLQEDLRGEEEEMGGFYVIFQNYSSGTRGTI